jgi:hypothetical protein
MGAVVLRGPEKPFGKGMYKMREQAGRRIRLSAIPKPIMVVP